MNLYSTLSKETKYHCSLSSGGLAWLSHNGGRYAEPGISVPYLLELSAGKRFRNDFACRFCLKSDPWLVAHKVKTRIFDADSLRNARELREGHETSWVRWFY